MRRIFLDANVLFSAAYKSGTEISQLWNLKDVRLCSSRYSLEEARVNLENAEQHTRLAELAGVLDFFEPTNHELPTAIRLPDKDIPIMLAAIEARANYLLTGDKRHFGSYYGKKIAGVTILPPSQYFKIRRRGDR